MRDARRGKSKAKSTSKGARRAKRPVRKPQRPKKEGAVRSAVNRGEEDFLRSFEGGPALQQLLSDSGSLADVEDVAGAFLDASRAGVPANVVIGALWEDEPRFESPQHARRMFGNLFGLYELIAKGEKVELGTIAHPVRVKREKAPQPLPFGDSEPTAEFVEAAWRWLDDHPKERERHVHAFNNRQDELVSWLDESGLSDAGFALASHLACDLFAMMELGGLTVETVYAEHVPPKVAEGALPTAFTEWIDEGVVEEEADDETPLPPHEGALVRDVASRLVAALWAARARPLTADARR